MQQFITLLIQTTIAEVVIILGVFFVLGFLLSTVQKATNNNYTRSIGWRGIYLTAWFGTPFHELSHYIMAKIFRHKVNRVALFEPNEETGGLGHVDHSFNKFSLYQRIGNFFIGAAPLLIGSGLLVLFAYLFVPNGKEIVTTLFQTHVSFGSIPNILADVARQLFSINNLDVWYFWIFLYISFCIASHIAPSKQDLKNMWRGFFWLILLLLFINIIPLWLKIDMITWTKHIASHFSLFTLILLYALCISVLHFLVTLLLFAFPRRVFRAIRQ